MGYEHAKLAEEKVFKDSVHRYIYVEDQVIWDLIGTREFQRLRRIKQLGTTYLVFHGAEHTRFQHSLGVYEIVRRIVDDGFQGRPEWNDDERLVALCAGLLHDLGHGPFSHAFENVFELDHEKFTQAILLGDTEVNQVLRRVSSEFPKKVAAVIGKTYENQLVVSLISSQIDADRMDYLQRDAYFTGVSYGHFDMERILRVMRPSENQVVIKESGMHAVEDYIMSRYQMYWQVYFHPVSRSAEVILTKILHRAKQLYERDYSFQHEPVHFQSFFNKTYDDLEQYIALDEGVMTTYFQLWAKEKDPILSDLSHRFINRKLFKCIDYNPDKDKKKLEKLIKLFEAVGINPNYYLVTDLSTDLPYDFYRPGEEKSRLPIYLKMDNNELQEISISSDIVDAISGKRRTDQKLYFPEDLLLAKREEDPLAEEILMILNSSNTIQ